VHGGADVSVVRQAAGDDEFTATGSSGARCGTTGALQRVRCVELLDMMPDLTGDPGGERIPETGEAEVDLTTRDRFPRIRVLQLVSLAISGAAEQQSTMRRCQDFRTSRSASSWDAVSAIVVAFARSR
jgi:hypothetical protein